MHHGKSKGRNRNSYPVFFREFFSGQCGAIIIISLFDDLKSWNILRGVSLIV
jgi:hypothetical protein